MQTKRKAGSKQYKQRERQAVNNTKKEKGRQ